MTINSKLISNALTNPSGTVRQQRRQLLRAFWLLITVLFILELCSIHTSSIANIVGAILIAFAALLPLYLWCSGSALGMPIFPVFAMTYLWTHALPLVGEQPQLLVYSPTQIFLASVTVSAFLLLGTFTWFRFVKSPPVALKSYRVFRGQDSDGFLLFILAADLFFNIYSVAGWFVLAGGTFTLIRSAILGLDVLSVFVLSYRCGTKELSENKSKLFLLLLVLSLIVNAASLLLVGVLSIGFLAVIAFTLGHRRVPWMPIIIVLICVWLLHYGKGEMRAKYWGKLHFVQPWEYPALYTEWIGYSFDYLKHKDYLHESEEKGSLLERSSVIQTLLLAQAKTPRDVAYLFGKTYAIIPEVLVPRIFNPKKIISHEGTSLLNIHYGLQTREATLTTTIGWGLLSEAYANFGFLGCAGLAIILGAAYGQASRWSINTPLFSFRSLFAVILISFAFQTEWTAGVYFAALFQSLAVLGVISLVFMKNYKTRDNSEFQ